MLTQSAFYQFIRSRNGNHQSLFDDVLIRHDITPREIKADDERMRIDVKKKTICQKRLVKRGRCDSMGNASSAVRAPLPVNEETRGMIKWDTGEHRKRRFPGNVRSFSSYFLLIGIRTFRWRSRLDTVVRDAGNFCWFGFRVDVKLSKYQKWLC